MSSLHKVWHFAEMRRGPGPARVFLATSLQIRLKEPSRLYPLSNSSARRCDYGGIGEPTSVRWVYDVGDSLACLRRTSATLELRRRLVGCTTWRTRRTANVGPTSGRRGLYDVFYTSAYRRATRRLADVKIRWRADVFYVGVPTCF